MTAKLEIRPVADADMAAIQTIYAHHVLHGLASWELAPPDLAELIARRDSVLQAGYPYVVAISEGRLAGYAHAGPYRYRPAYRFTVENTIYLHPDQQGKNIARPLLQRVIDDCAVRGYRQMIAVIGDSGNHASIRFHEKMGFHHAGLIEGIGWKAERWLDSVMMQLSLGPGNSKPPQAPA
ncbi:MAG: GNAT family N-acetyltransferase [Proteobacteria bacterium]|nr:GNAT family N-acetyltransferase [Pseudomonadota bacterium]